MAEIHTDTTTLVDIDGVSHNLRIRVDIVPVEEPPPPVDPNVTIIDGYHEFEEIHVHEGRTLWLKPGAELVRINVPPVDPEHGDGGIVVHGHIKAVRLPNENPIIIRSQAPSGVRGHLMIHGTAELDGIEIRDMGRTKIDLISTTNPIARYALHFHLAGDNGYISRVENCLIHDTVLPSVYRHGIVIHGTNGLTIRGNTIRNKGGTGIFTEDGTERNNLIEGNVIEYIRNYNGLNSHTTVSPRPVERATWKNDFGFEGAGIWLRGTANIVRGNTIRFCAIGAEIFADLSPTQYEPINEISGNVVEDCYDGFQPWFLGADNSHNHITPPLCPSKQYVDSFTIRRCKRGVFSYYCGRVSFRDFSIEQCLPTGWTMGDYRHWECEIIRPKFTGCGTGLAVGTYINNGLLIDQGAFSGNTVDVVVETLWHNNDGRVLPPRSITLQNCMLNAPTMIKKAPTADGQRNFVQLDTFLVENHKGIPEDDFFVYFDEQSPSAILAQTSNGGKVVGCPVAGLSNQQALVTYGLTRAGQLLPDGASTRSGIVGMIKGV